MNASPPPRLAPNLQVATSRDIVHIDRGGRVRSPLRYRIVLGTYYGLLAILALVELALVYSLFQSNGALGASFGAIVAIAFSWCAWVLSRQFTLRRALREFANDRRDRARALYESVLKAPLLPGKYRAAADQGLAACASIDGRHAEALAHLRAAQKRQGRRRTIHARLASYAEIGLLVNTQELAEARAKFEALGDVPEGEYFRLAHWGAELYLALAEGKHSIDDDELHQRATAALAITSAAPLLGLLAWAFAHRGDRDMAELLLREARDRHPGAKLAGPMPLLEAWMNEQAESPPIDDGERVDEEEEELVLADERASRRASRD